MYTEGDPVNESDQLGLFPGQGFLDRVRHDLIAGNDAASRWLNNQANRIGCENGLGNGVFASAFNCGDSASSSSCPAAAGTLNPGSSEADARSALESQGVDIPSNYYGSPSRSGNGWVFRPDGSTNDDNSIRIMEQGTDPQYPNGYYRCHLFRHTAATLMLDAGADVRHVAEMLGHQKLETTMIYTRVSLAKLREVHAACHPAG
jgi:hypothetical protein